MGRLAKSADEKEEAPDALSEITMSF